MSKLINITNKSFLPTIPNGIVTRKGFIEFRAVQGWDNGSAATRVRLPTDTWINVGDLFPTTFRIPAKNWRNYVVYDWSRTVSLSGFDDTNYQY